jgi:uncharacterized membrane protein YqjE
MDASTDNPPHLVDSSKRVAQQAFVIFENRMELLVLELQEERNRILRAFWLSLAVAVFAFLTGVALSIAIAVACWHWSPLGAMLILAALYASIAGLLFQQLAQLRRDWQSFPATLDELRKDCECLEKGLN